MNSALRRVSSLEFVVRRKTTSYQLSTVDYRRRRLGFTLVEVLIVIAIMSILATVIVTAVDPLKRKSQARDATRKSDIGQLANALKAYYTTSDTYPEPSGPGSVSGMTALTANGDLKLIPHDPLDNEYQYVVSGSGVKSEAALYITVEDPTSGSGNWVWCWRSTITKPGEVASGNCSP